VTEGVSRSITNFPHAEYRNVNLSRAAKLIAGTLLRGTRYSREANCEESSGTSGSSIDVFRFFRDRILARCSVRSSSTPTTSPATT